MFVLPLIYCTAFFAAIHALYKKREQGIFLFIVFGLPIYTISLSVSYMFGLEKLIPFFQLFKEASILLFLLYAITNLKSGNNWTSVDKLMFSFLFINILYAVLPIGTYTFFERLVALKSLSFFPLVYFTGRLLNKDHIHMHWVYTLIGLLTIAVAGVLAIELLTYTHIQSISGYAGFNDHFFDQDPSGSYGLTWTFEIENGMKRFASLFSTPLELAAASLISLAAVAAMVTTSDNKISLNSFTAIALVASMFCVSFALSRASFASYCIMLYVYAILTKKKLLLQLIHTAALTAAGILVLISFNNDFVDFIINSITFTNASSVGHLIEWANGLESIIKNPLGIGLGNAGRISGFSGYNVGGENQFIIIGVQTGIITAVIYIAIYFMVMRRALQLFKTQTGKIRRLALFIFLVKVGMLIPLFTSEAESYIYISYITWILTGLLMSMSSRLEPSTK
ncbi:MAG: O-antigen ligase family protein [Sediminibacterium sp.]